MLQNGFFPLIGFGIGSIFAIFLFWSVIWKGFALWIAARENKRWWFIALLVVNLAGIFEIIYIFLISDWGKNFLKGRKNKSVYKDNECDCTSCNGKNCDCDCHNSVEN